MHQTVLSLLRCECCHNFTDKFIEQSLQSILSYSLDNYNGRPM